MNDARRASEARLDDAAARMPARARPPRPRFALTLGVVGRRLDRIAETAQPKVRADIDDAMKAVAAEMTAVMAQQNAVFQGGSPHLTVVTPLAEGADRFAALAAVKRKAALDVVLPFAQSTYENDFPTRESKEEFRGLLQKARSVLVLPGDPDAGPKRDRAYELAGLTVLAQADLLLVVWDGQPDRGRAGTLQMMSTAQRQGMPVVLVDAQGNRAPCIIWRGLGTAPTGSESLEDLPERSLEEGLRAAVAALTRLPSGDGELTELKTYLDREWIAFRNWPMWGWLLALVGLRPMDLVGLSAASTPAGCSAELENVLAPMNSEQLTELIQAFGWADALASYHAHKFRSAVVSNFFLSALATSCAAAATLVEHQHMWHVLMVGFECMLVLVVIVTTARGRRGQWHRRWFELREIAERLRAAVPFWRIGAMPQSVGGDEPAWTGWYVRALLRQQPLSSGEISAQTLTGLGRMLRRVVDSQAAYHERHARTMERLNTRLQHIGFLLLVISLGTAIFYIILELLAECFGSGSIMDLRHAVEKPLPIVGVSFPALAIAFYGVRLIGDVEGAARRSARSQDILQRLSRSMDRDVDDLSVIRAWARQSAEIMLGDVANWRVAAESRSLEIPG